jgi:nucleotide-binding universal stress UspA family protein
MDGGQDAGGGSLQRILVPVDGAGRAADAVAVAARLSGGVGGRLRLVHVRIFDPPVRNSGRYYPESKAEAEAVVEGAVLDAWTWGSRATGDVVVAQRAHIARTIVRVAQHWDAGVIVIARRPRRALTRLLLGSVADEVLHRATCPVLVVRPGLR